MTNRSYLACFAFLLITWQSVPWANPTEQATDDANSATEFNRLNSKALADGSVQVMVIMKDTDGDDPLPKSREQEAIRENNISKAQEALLAKLPVSKRASAKRLRAFPVIALSASSDDLKQLQASPHVAEIVEDKMNSLLTLTASVNKAGGNAAWALGYTGAGQTIAIIDNGIDKNHPFLINKVVKEACFSTTSKAQKVTSSCRKKRSRDIKTGAASLTCKFQDFACTHGTLLANLAAGNSGQSGFAGSGVAPAANIIAIKVDSLIKNKNVCGSTTPCSVFFDSDLLRGLEFVYKQRNAFRIAAVNVSIGGSSSPKSCKKSPIKKTVAKLRAAGIATLAASGNDGSNKKLSTPACVTGVIAVGASTDADSVAPFSNSNSQLALLAPGVNIGLAMPGVTLPGFEVIANGTSLASALVTGAWASLKSHNPNASVDQILAALTNSGVPLFDPKNGIVKPRIQVNQAHALLP